MKRNSVVFLLALCPLIPVSSHFAYALLISGAFLFYFVSGIFFRFVISKINPGSSSFYFELAALAVSATFFYQFSAFFFPVLTVSLDIYYFLAAFSYVLLLSIDYYAVQGFSFLPVFRFIPILLIFSLCRELIGTGGISLPVMHGFWEIHLLPGFSVWGSGFWNTTAGSFILLGFMTWIVKSCNRYLSGRGRT